MKSDGLKSRKVRLSGGTKSFSADEHVRETSLESLEKLSTVFSEVGVLTAGNCSGIVDGAASVIVSDRKILNSGNAKTDFKNNSRHELRN